MAKKSRKEKQDGWANVTTGFGEATHDKRLSNTFTTKTLTAVQAERIWRGDDIAARIVETVPDEMIREGFEISISPDEEEPKPEDGATPEEKPAPFGTKPEAQDPNKPEAQGQNPAEKKPPENQDPNAPKKPGEPDKNPDEQKKATEQKPNPDAAKKPGEPDKKPGEPAQEEFKELPPEQLLKLSPEDLAKYLEALKANKAERKDLADEPTEEDQQAPDEKTPFGESKFKPAKKGAEEASQKDPSDEAKDLSEAMSAELRRLDAMENLRRGLHYGRALGGGGVLMGVDDGTTDLSTPLDEKRIRKFDWLAAYTPSELVAERFYSDPSKPKYGDVEVYRLVPQFVPPGSAGTAGQLVHETRVLRFTGVQTTRAASYNGTNPGWDDSVLNRVVQIISDFQTAWAGAAIIMQDFSVPVLKVKGLFGALAGRTSGSQSMAARAAAVELCRSIARVVLLDADQEEYKRESTSVVGLADLLDKLMLRVAAAAKMPVSVLMGQAPAGLNATGDSDIRWFYDQVSADQERYLRPVLMRLIRMIFLNPNGPAKGKEPKNWDIRFNPLWQLSEKEQAEVRQIQANVDKIYLEAQVLSPEEVAVSRFGGDSYSTDTQIDIESRKRMQQDMPFDEKLSQEAEQAHALEMEKAKNPAKPFGDNANPFGGGKPPAKGKPGQNPFAKG